MSKTSKYGAYWSRNRAPSRTPAYDAFYRHAEFNPCCNTTLCERGRILWKAADKEFREVS